MLLKPMNDPFETEALRYLLNEMDAESRAAFEARLARDPAARVGLKSCADAVAHFACEQAPAAPMSATDQRAALNAILARTSSGQAEAPAAAAPVATNVIPWTRYVWPMAAAALLMLNLIDFRRPVPARGGTSTAGEGSALAQRGGTEPDANESGARASIEATDGNAELRGSTLAGSATSGEAEPRVAATFAVELAKTSRELARLRDEHAKLQRTTAALRGDYDAVTRQWATRVAFDQSVGRLAAMELVDERSYALGDRRGLVEVARSILTEPGVVVASDGAIAPGVEPPGAAGVDPQPSALAPYAWAVFDDKEQRGYLNLYNLPTLAQNEALQLWVRAADRAEYQRVGEVPPAFYGGSGSVQYRMTEGMAPAEILITREPRDTVVEQPAGPTVLRGP